MLISTVAEGVSSIFVGRVTLKEMHERNVIVRMKKNDTRTYMNIFSSLTHSVDRLTGDGSLRPPDVAITGHVPSSISSEPDVELQLVNPSLSGTTSWTFPFWPHLSSGR